uniref:DUF255 domain-containing protein n=1 Tax=Panagrolaimus davidi TaxID=227884 RepID=A0A914Q3I5_9BILA
MSSRLILTRLLRFTPRLSSMAGHAHSGPANRLAQEKSPYLLQHAHNPVDWYPWSDEAFKAAKEKNLPIFLSERPDVDKLYMAFVVSVTGHGGWPMSVFLTPEGEPLTGGTYFPPKDSFASLGFESVLKLVSEQWKSNNESVLAQGKALSKAIQKELAPKPGQAPSANHMIQNCYEHLIQTFDEEFGGFGASMKFPKPVDLEFLLYYFKHNSQAEPGQFAKEMIDKTLYEIDKGGIHDHLGKGFHRYAVDRQWKIPHYEKMLYDQGQLLSIYSNFYKITGKYKEVIEDIVEYVKKDLLHKDGGFCSAEDAESYPIEGAPKKKEGAFYVWTKQELEDALTPEQFTAFQKYYNIKEEGNCPDGSDPRGELKQNNTLFIGGKNSIVKIAEEMKISVEEFEKLIEDGKKALLVKRDERPRPGLDFKIITSWNSLMISGLTAAYGAFPEKKEYLEMAQKAVKFLKENLVDDQDRLLRTAYSDENRQNVFQIFSKHSKPILAFSDDYAFLIQALLDLYEADFDESHLKWAEKLQNQMDEHFFDKQHSVGYFNSRDTDSTVFARLQEDQDGAEPCSNSIACNNLLRLSDIFGDKEYRKKAGDIFNGHAKRLETHAYALPKMVIAANRFASAATQHF